MSNIQKDKGLFFKTSKKNEDNISDFKIASLIFLIVFILINIVLTLIRTTGVNIFKSIPPNLHNVFWCIFLATIILILFILFGIGFKNFFCQKKVWKSKRHLVAFSASSGIIFNYFAMGNHQKIPNGNIFSKMFDVSFYFAVLLILCVVIIWLVSFIPKLKKEQKEDGNPFLYNDDSIQDEKEDSLGRNKFAKQLVESILKSNGKLTIGLYGPWGAGKSSVFSLMNKAFPKEQITMNFTPWYFGEKKEDIILEFLEFFSNEIKKSKSYDTGLEKELVTYMNFFKSFQLRSNGMTIPIGELLKGFLPKESDIKSVKKSIDDMLKESDDKIVVFIDDLDRLDRDEILTVFKLVRLICDFPNVVYVLALDEEVVSLALGEVYGKPLTIEQQTLKGRSYLEKFIQVPIYLPMADELELQNILIEGLQNILNQHNLKTGVFEGINSTIYPVIQVNMFGTIRNIKRYLNLVQIFIPLLKDEVFIDDLLYLLAIKVTCPSLYEWIRKHPHLLYSEDEKYLKENVDVDVFRKEYAKFERVVEELFPKMAVVYGKSVSVSRKKKNELPNSQLSISKRIYFAKYFMYDTPKKQVSQEQLQKIYSLVEKDIETATTMFIEICSIYPINDIFGKITSDIIIHNDATSLNLIYLLEAVYVKSEDYKVQSEIEKYLYTNFIEKREITLQYALSAKPKALVLLTQLRNTIKSKRNDSLEIMNKIDEVINTHLKNFSLADIVKNTSLQKKDTIFLYLSQNCQEMSKRKFTEYITSVSEFLDVSYIFYDYQMPDIVFYQKLLMNIESEVINKYINDTENNVEEQEIIIKIKRAIQKAIPYIIGELDEALEKSEEQNIKCIMDSHFEEQLKLFMGAEIAKKYEKDLIEEKLESIKNYNNYIDSTRV